MSIFSKNLKMSNESLTLSKWRFSYHMFVTCFRIQQPAGNEDDMENDDNDPDIDGDDPTGSPASSVEVKALCLSDNVKRIGQHLAHHPPITGGVDERCLKALEHIMAVSHYSHLTVFAGFLPNPVPDKIV